MRLLKTGPFAPGTQRLELVQVWGQDIKPYAILSHTWSKNSDDEVLLADIQNGIADTKPAFQKLWKAIERTKLDGYGYLWVDTCCIDKTSSVELSEAINSMYTYYERAEKCYAFLSDVSKANRSVDFPASRWWRRGWTLQELLAPKELVFFSNEWEPLGSKSDLSVEISQAIKIDAEYLTGVLPLHHASIAKRMSWAASRETTRDEDLAYCLIGIFDVNMPMLYGEGGTRAFLRLQEEIMKESEDQSLYAWKSSNQGQTTTTGDYHGLLASSPYDFRQSGAVIPYSQLGEFNPATMTARGLHLTLPLIRKSDGTCVAALQCPNPERGYNGWLALYLQKLPNSSNQYARISCHTLAYVSSLGTSEEIYIRQRFPKYDVQTMYLHHFFQIRRLFCIAASPELTTYKMTEATRAANTHDTKHFPTASTQVWSDVELVYKIDRRPGALTTAILVKRLHDQESFVLMLGATTEYEVGFDAVEEESLGKFHDLQDIFEPTRSGTRRDLEFHQIEVKFEERVQAGQKIFFVDVEIRAYPPPTTITDVLHDAANFITQPHDDNTNQHVNDKAAVIDKLKRLRVPFLRQKTLDLATYQSERV